MIISPDEGGTNRAVYLANVLGLDMGMFYKRRDYSKIVDGRNPIVAHEFLGSSVEGKDVIIIDDMISSGESMIDVATELKKTKGKPYLRLLLPSDCSPTAWRSLTRLLQTALSTRSLPPT